MFRFVGQREVEAVEQDGEVGLGATHCAEMDFLTGAGGEYHVHRTHFGHFFEQFARRRAQAAGGHPLLERAPENEAQEAYKNVGLCAILAAVENWTQAQVVFCDAEAFVKFLIESWGKTKFLETYGILKASNKDSRHLKNRKDLERIYGKPLNTLRQQWYEAAGLSQKSD